MRDLYSIKPISTSRRVLLTERISKDLSDWRVELTRFLDIDFSKTTETMPIFQRQQNVLNLTYRHSIILTYRPFLLNDLTRTSPQGSLGGNENIHTTESVQQCLAAAMNTVNTIDKMTHARQMYRAFWVGTVITCWQWRRRLIGVIDYSLFCLYRNYCALHLRYTETGIPNRCL